MVGAGGKKNLKKKIGSRESESWMHGSGEMRNHGRGNRTEEDGFIGRGIGKNGTAGRAWKWGVRRDEGGGGGGGLRGPWRGRGGRAIRRQRRRRRPVAAAVAAAAWGSGSGGGVGLTA